MNAEWINLTTGAVPNWTTGEYGSGQIVIDRYEDLLQKKYPCSWCGGQTFDDGVGHCAACGGPRDSGVHDAEKYVRAYFEHGVMMSST